MMSTIFKLLSVAASCDIFSIAAATGVLNHTSGTQADKADATITLSRDTLNKVILKETKLKEVIDSGDVKIAGRQAKLDEMLSYLDSFDFWFNIVTP